MGQPCKKLREGHLRQREQHDENLRVKEPKEAEWARETDRQRDRQGMRDLDGRRRQVTQGLTGLVFTLRASGSNWQPWLRKARSRDSWGPPKPGPALRDPNPSALPALCPPVPGAQRDRWLHFREQLAPRTLRAPAGNGVTREGIPAPSEPSQQGGFVWQLRGPRGLRPGPHCRRLRGALKGGFICVPIQIAGKGVARAGTRGQEQPRS